MDMSVKAGGDTVTVEQPKSRPATDRRNASDLDLWLEKAEAMGELKRITAEVSADLEAAHITYLSEAALHRKFGRNLQDRTALTFGFDADFQIESYLRYQGQTFVDRFDANSYLYMTRSMDYFDLAADHGGRLPDVVVGD